MQIISLAVAMLIAQTDAASIKQKALAQAKAKADIDCGRVTLLDGEAFEASFSRFEGDEVNGYSDEKAAYAGQRGTVVENWDDNTAYVVFDDGAEFDFPMESMTQKFGDIDWYQVGLGCGGNF